MPPPQAPADIRAEAIVGETMRAFPGTLAVFLRRKMHCPGCHMASFMTLREAAASHGVLVDDLVTELRQAALSPA
ncbi:MAG: DUF1858 domain-containing protein [Kiloniellaceae bacterium]